MASSDFVRQNFKSLILATLILAIPCSVSFGQTEPTGQNLSFKSVPAVAENKPINEITRPRLITNEEVIQTDKEGIKIVEVQNISNFKPRTIFVTSSAVISQLEMKAFDLINEKRKENGLSPILWNEDVAKVARLHSQNMAKFKFFSHIGQDGSMVHDRADALGISDWKAIGENIAYNRGYEKPAEFACERWMLSSSHRENILNRRWKEAGIGVAINSDGTYYFTQVFVVR
jgi:uncharacterized protein YkwD